MIGWWPKVEISKPSADVKSRVPNFHRGEQAQLYISSSFLLKSLTRYTYVSVSTHLPEASQSPSFAHDVAERSRRPSSDKCTHQSQPLPYPSSPASTCIFATWQRERRMFEPVVRGRVDGFRRLDRMVLVGLCTLGPDSAWPGGSLRTLVFSKDYVSGVRLVENGRA